MTTTPLPSPRIPLQTCDDLLNKLKWDFAQFENGWTEYRTFNFVITAYHLYNDWIKNAGSHAQKKRKSVVSRHAKGKLLFQTLRDLTNSSKHFMLDLDNQQRQVVLDVSPPMIGSVHNWFFEGPVIHVTVGDARPDMPDLADAAVKCLEWIVNGVGKSLPIQIAEKLDIIFRPST